MPLNLASPGIVVREVDLTIGRTTPSSNKIGALVAPFAKGPIDVPTLVENENDLLTIFGEPYSTDKHYEHWLSASSYLAYGGSLRVVRADDTEIRNGFIGTASSVKIKSLEHYIELGYDENILNDVTFAAKNPGSWSNGIHVSIVDARADQTLVGIDTSGLDLGYGVTQSVDGRPNPGIGVTSTLSGNLKGIITGIGVSQIDVKVLSLLDDDNNETAVDYEPLSSLSFENDGSVDIFDIGGTTSTDTLSYDSATDWFDNQVVAITSTSYINWNNIAQRPKTSSFAIDRGSRFDEVHVVITDALGKITGNAGTILEKHLSLSKASDAQFSVGSSSYWRKYLQDNSRYVFACDAPSGVVTTGYSSEFNLATDTGWNQPASGIIFSCIGSQSNPLRNGTDYNGELLGSATSGPLEASLAELSDGYTLFESTENLKVDFLLMGSAGYDQVTAQSLAKKLISVAEIRKDAIAFISPYRGGLVVDNPSQTSTSVNSAEKITENLISFYAPISSSSYAIFDSGYKYMYDRFSDTFRYVPLNGDIAGLCARNDINNFPWFSPAGTTRGAILNAVKLAYNPTKSQRDRLYSNRINPVIFSPGAGIILFGDRTGFGVASAFDRINVRRLFIYLEDAISKAAKDQLFEFNDEITRSNFVNTVEPFLRDIQSKRGIFDYVVICDETNNTASVIDNNEFIADIYIKPSRSINFIGLTFVATKTGVDFEEVIGNV